MSTYRMDAQAARGLLVDYMAEDDDEVTTPERVAALADALHDALREIEDHRGAPGHDACDECGTAAPEPHADHCSAAGIPDETRKVSA